MDLNNVKEVAAKEVEHFYSMMGKPIEFDIILGEFEKISSVIIDVRISILDNFSLVDGQYQQMIHQGRKQEVVKECQEQYDSSSLRLISEDGFYNSINNPIETRLELNRRCYDAFGKEFSHQYLVSILDTTTQKAKPVLKLSDKKGAKTDLIRVLNALYELRLFNKTDGQIPTKQEFMETLGEYLGVDLSKYHSNLSQALQNQPLEVNLKVFEDMKEATQKAHFQTKTK